MTPPSFHAGFQYQSFAYLHVPIPRLAIFLPQMFITYRKHADKAKQPEQASVKKIRT
jgi:hypothetical protein